MTDGDLAALIADEILLKGQQNRYELKRYSVKTGEGPALAVVTLATDGGEISDAATGNGPVDAAYRAIWRAIELEPKLIAFGINATSDHSDAMGEAMVTLRSGDIVAPGRGVSTDIVESAIKALIHAVNRLYILAAARGVELQKKRKAA